MISSFDLQNLNKLLKDFYTAVGIRISIFDDEFRPVTEYPEELTAFCQNIRRSEEGEIACKKCDHDACIRAKKLGKPHIYTCHAGITEAITPIRIGGGVLGYAILAHMLPEENYADAVENACLLAEKYGVTKEESLLAINEIQPKSTRQIESSVKILDAVSSYVYIQNLVRWKNDDIASRIEKYIRKNLSKQLTSEIICQQFNCSRSSLYQLSVKRFGMGIMQYITKVRIERAKELLAEGKSISDTTEECGFSDYNYFCKVFRKHTGVSPSAYRKQRK